MGPHVHFDQGVARRPATNARQALSLEAQYLTVTYAGRNCQIERAAVGQADPLFGAVSKP
jgi:hypothetical protein